MWKYFCVMMIHDMISFCPSLHHLPDMTPPGAILAAEMASNRTKEGQRLHERKTH